MKQTLRLKGKLCPKTKPLKKLFTIPIIFTIVLVSCVCTRAQVSVSSQGAGPAAGAVSLNNRQEGLQIGDTIPNALWSLPLEVVNDPEGEKMIALGDHRDKLIILDFWATWCSSCIEVMPRLDSLQKEFHGELQVIPITDENGEKALSLLHRKSLDLISVVNQTELRKEYFPYRMIPHQIWILNGRVNAITAGEEATSKNIHAVINQDKGVRLEEKKDVLNYDYAANVTKFAKQTGTPVLFSSSLTRFINGLGSSMGLRAVNNKTNVVNYVNSPVLKMYQRTLKVPNNRIVLATENNDKYVVKRKEDQKPKLYSYQLFIPTEVGIEQVNDKIIHDLNNYFDLKVVPERLTVSCFVIKKAGNDVEEAATTFDNGKYRTYKFADFVKGLNFSILWSPEQPIFIDESGFEGNLRLPKDIYAYMDYDKLKELLSGYGFTVVEVERELDMFVIADR